jgi:hypothetical protein
MALWSGSLRFSAYSISRTLPDALQLFQHGFGGKENKGAIAG